MGRHKKIISQIRETTGKMREYFLESFCRDEKRYEDWYRVLTTCSLSPDERKFFLEKMFKTGNLWGASLYSRGYLKSEEEIEKALWPSLTNGPDLIFDTMQYLRNVNDHDMTDQTFAFVRQCVLDCGGADGLLSLLKYFSHRCPPSDKDLFIERVKVNHHRTVYLVQEALVFLQLTDEQKDILESRLVMHRIIQ